ncbi:hypothetical protein BV898_02329 [Hypsibius exemplaris]|uniref:Uncharacterized protein n=1 Tax=Hypsibius exemplaris TaxID=2072580 RepID=A0A1W0X901_HYPEX|nr:hypothetical protein BV898_02329 [Hypsibius exemplaris]
MKLLCVTFALAMLFCLVLECTEARILNGIPVEGAREKRDNHYHGYGRRNGGYGYGRRNYGRGHYGRW